MKTLVAAIAQAVIALAVVHASACSTATAVKKAAAADEEHARREALVKELEALVAQGPLHFDTDTDLLTEEAQVLLTRIAAQMHRVSKVRVVIAGNCDERGDSGYNLALGDKRAFAARDYLVRLGIPKERIKMVSLGEEDPLAMGHNEESWAKNRRDEFTFLLPGESKSVLNIHAQNAAVAADDDDARPLLATTTFPAQQ